MRMERFGRGEKEVVKGQQVATEHMMAIVFDVRMKEWDPRNTQQQYTHCQPKHGKQPGQTDGNPTLPVVCQGGLSHFQLLFRKVVAHCVIYSSII